MPVRASAEHLSGEHYITDTGSCVMCLSMRFQLPSQHLLATCPAMPLRFAVIAISSLDRETGCWSFWDDCFDVWDILSDWRSEWG